MMDVIVIGCGASGIAALRSLHYAGLNALGLEAADRIGGRIHTLGFGDGIVDIGAAWADDKENNAVLDLVKPFDLLKHEMPDHKLFLLSNGDLVPNDQNTEILKELNEIISTADKEDTTPVLEHIQNIVRSSKAYKNNPQLYESLKEWFKRAYLIDGKCDPLKSRSLKSLDEFQVEREYMLHWKGKGYKTVLDILLNKYPDPSKEIPLHILLNKEVNKINWLLNNESGDQTVEVQCTDGSLYIAKSVIVTMSLGVLKERHSKLFNPPLPLEKANAISNMEFGVLGKVYIEFTKPWWQEIPSTFFIVWRENDKVQLSEEEQWITGIYGLETVVHQPNSLLAWTYGLDAEKMENASEESIKIGIQKLLDMVFKKQFMVTPVKNIIRSKWASDPLTRGTFAYRSIATEKFGGSRQILSEPLYIGDRFPVVCFAGEATAEKYFGSVAGAIESGYREAERLIEKLKC